MNILDKILDILSDDGVHTMNKRGHDSGVLPF